MNLGQRLKSERERLGLSQTEFAALAAASKHAQINWEKGDASPNAAALQAWSAHGVDVLYVITGQRTAGAPAPEPLSREQRALLDNYEACGPEGRDAIRRTATALAQPDVAARKKTAKRSA